MNKAYGCHAEALPAPARKSAASVLFNCVQAVVQVASAKGSEDKLAPTNEIIVGGSMVAVPQAGTNATNFLTNVFN